jgi:hypothetical protein
VQIDLGLDSVLTAAEFAEDAVLDSIAREDEFLAAGELGVCGIAVEALLEDCKAVGAGEAGAWLRSRGLGRSDILGEGFYVPYRFAE